MMKIILITIVMLAIISEVHFYIKYGYTYNMVQYICTVPQNDGEMKINILGWAGVKKWKNKLYGFCF